MDIHYDFLYQNSFEPVLIMFKAIEFVFTEAFMEITNFKVIPTLFNCDFFKKKILNVN